MFGEITAWLLEMIQTHGILAVILGVAIETIIVPIPSPIILMTAGYFLIPHGTILSIIWAALWISVVAGIAQTIGSYMLYFIGYYGGKPIIERFEKLHGVSWKEIKNFQKKFSKKRKEEITLFFLRALPIMPLSIISGVVGIMKMDFKKYSIATLLGVIPRNFMLALAGFMFSGFYEIIAKYIDHAETVMTFIIVMLILTYIAGHKFGIFEKLRKNILK
jgi:membrane protein DedA with SNARE-associated domain